MNIYSWVQLIFYMVVLLALAKPLGFVHGESVPRREDISRSGIWPG